MRLLQVATGRNEILDLHPNVTVAVDLDEAARGILVATVAGLAKGQAPRPGALLEAHGVMFDLSGDLLEMLDLRESEIDPIVDGDDLPTKRAAPAARELRALLREQEELEVARRAARAAQTQAFLAAQSAAEAVARARLARSERAAAETHSAGSAALDEALEQQRRCEETVLEVRHRLEAARAHRSEVEAATADVRRARDEAVAARERAAAALAMVAASLDDGAADELEAARGALEALEVELQEHGSIGADGEAPLSPRRRLELQIEDLRKQLAAFGSVQVAEVERALERLRSLDAIDTIPDPIALELADRLDSIDDELEANRSRVGDPAAVAEARSRLDDARQALLEAEQAVRNPPLDPGQVQRLEVAHTTLLDALDRADRRFGGGRYQRQVDEARAEERAVLDELGFASYASYMMGASVAHADPAKEAALAAARAEMAAAEAAWAHVERDIEADLARAALLDRRRAALEEATRLVGPSIGAATAAAELRARRVPAVTVADLTSRLQGALDEAGLALGDELLDPVELEDIAEVWLAEARGAEERERELLGELREREAQLAAMAADPDDDGADGPESRLAAARSRVADAEARLGAHLEASDRHDPLAEALAAAEVAARAAVEQAVDADRAVEEAAAIEAELTAELARGEESLAVATAALDELRSESGAPSDEPDALERELADAEEAEAAAAVEAASATAALDELDAQAVRLSRRIEANRAATGDAGDASVAEEVEWYLLARLATQRSVSLTGSMPLVLDAALDDLEDDDIWHVLGRLERMADAVQVIVVSEHPAARLWAEAAGPSRAAVVSPGPAIPA